MIDLRYRRFWGYTLQKDLNLNGKFDIGEPVGILCRGLRGNHKMAESLPEECWELILKNIREPNHWQSVSLVCKQFLSISNRLCYSMKISTSFMLPGGLSRILSRFTGLQEIDLENFNGNLARPIQEITRSRLQLRALSLKGQKGLPISAVTELGKSCKTLRSLNCSKFHFLRDEDLVAIAHAFPSLEELDISYPVLRIRAHQLALVQFDASLYPGAISDEGIHEMATMLCNLRVINISGNYFLSDSSLIALSSACIKLQGILVFDCPLVTDRGLHIIGQQCFKLTSVAVNGLQISSLGIKTFLSSVKNLEYLDLSLLTISDDLLLCMGELKIPLRTLILTRCKGITSVGIIEFAKACPNLCHLNLDGAHYLTDETMKVLARSFHTIKHLSLNFCSLLTDTTFFALLKHSRKLKVLEMESTGLGWGSARMGSGQDPCKLKSLKIAWNKAVGNVTLRSIAELCPRLLFLDASHCSLVTDTGLMSISKGCPGLRKLMLKGCKKVMGLGLDEGFMNLEHLQVGGTGFTDSGLIIVGKCCRHLLGLDLEGCLRITECGLKKVLEDCRQLRQVNLKDCKCVNIDALAWMVFSQPSLRRLVPPSSCVSENQKALLLRHGCRVLTAQDS